MQAIIDFCVTCANWFWGIPVLLLIGVGGLYMSMRLGFPQITKIGYICSQTFGKMFTKAEGDKISPFAAACSALGSAIGASNIVGVPVAIALGGPGAIFWMWVSALFGMCTKYAEVTLAVHYREINANGELVGGPMYYIKNGLSKKWHWLAYLFAAFGVLTVFGTGNATQVNTITTAINSALLNYNVISESAVSTSNLIIGIIIAILIAMILLGGIKRIGHVTEKLVPFMALLYILLGLGVILLNIQNVPAVFASIFRGAFQPRAVTGGIVLSMFTSLKKGVSRGIFSNEAGLGSAPIAAAAARTNEPVRQGLVSMTATFIDTIIICSITGIAIVLTGAYDMGLEGVAVTTKAFQLGLPFPDGVASFILMLCLVFFAFTTILGWDYYSERCLEYLTNGKKKCIKAYRWIYILCVFIGPYMTVSAVWTIADIFNGLMAIPNLIALVALSGVVAKETKDYLNRIKKKEIE